MTFTKEELELLKDALENMGDMPDDGSHTHHYCCSCKFEWAHVAYDMFGKERPEYKGQKHFDHCKVVELLKKLNAPSSLERGKRYANEDHDR